MKFYHKVSSSQASGAILCDDGGAICAYVRRDDFVPVDFG
jgi:hypothetical protein